jgi:broad specificity phosphatase PhoE
MDTTSTITANFRKLRRRPLITPLLIPVVLLGLIVAAGVWALDARNSPVVIIVRHADVDSGAEANPPLNDAGRARALRLQTTLAHLNPNRGLDAIYVQENLRSQQTATPVADSMGLALNVMPQATLKGIKSIIRRNHAGETVLVVADRASVEALLAEYSDHVALPEEADFGALYVVTAARLSKPTVVRLQY